MLVKLKDQKTLELPEKSTAKDLAEKMNLRGPDQALGVTINEKKCDLTQELNEGDFVEFWNFDDPKGKEIFWHTSAHVLAQAIQRLYPDAKPTIGPPIENGFYYDFADLRITDADLDKIEKEMQAIISENYVSKKEVFATKEEALKAFSHNKYKTELIHSFASTDELTGYRQGEFFDLCRGPHLFSLGKIKALKAIENIRRLLERRLTTGNAYPYLRNLFPDRKLLKEYLLQLEEAKKRDHKILGPQLDLFSLKEEAPGMPFIHQKGMIIWNTLLSFIREYLDQGGYIEIKTPTMMTRELWERSGHWANYREHMFTAEVEDHDYAIKPMNCPG